MASNPDDDDFKPTSAPGYSIPPPKDLADYVNMDKTDESLQRWKASLGIKEDVATAADGPKVTVLELELISNSLPENRRIILDVTDPTALEGAKKTPITIKEGVEFNVVIRFRVNHSIVSVRGVRYMQVVKRAGIRVDRMEQMLGSYGVAPDGQPYTKTFDTEEAPSGMLARSGTFNVTSRVMDDDNEVHADFDWSFKIAKEW